MPIKTTVNIHENILDKINNAAIRTGKSRTYIIRLLLRKVLDDNGELGKLWTAVQYQRRDRQEKRFTFHLNLREDEYEFCMDLRKIFKMSLSKIIAISVIKYIEWAIQMLIKLVYTGDSDNYLYKNYGLSRRVINGIVCWRLSWGVIPELYQVHPQFA